MEDVYKEAINTFGKKMQLLVAIEELGELMKEVIKALRGKEDIDHIAEETADVEIMVEQLKLMYGIDNSKIKAAKIERLKSLLKVGENA